MWHERLKSIIEALEDRLSLRQQIGLLNGALGVVIVFALAIAAATVARERALQHMAAEAARLAGGFAQSLDHHLDVQVDRLRTWVQLAPLQQTWNADPERLRRWARRRNAPSDRRPAPRSRRSPRPWPVSSNVLRRARLPPRLNRSDDRGAP